MGDQPGWLAGFTSSLGSDRLIYREVVLTAYAHLLHLLERGLVPGEAREALGWLREALDREDEVLRGNYEDVHEALEAWLLERAGRSAGWLAYGKSRNDQVATALRLALRRELIGLLREVNGLRGALLDAAEGNLKVKFPLFTHLRPAQPSLASHYLLHVEGEASHHYGVLWHVLREVVDLCPLGSGPAAGSSVPLDRERLAELLGFRGVEVNSLLATGSRTFASLALGPVASLTVALSRVAEDLIVWSTPSFALVELPEEHVSTSSIMPQKRNPVTLEVVRARAADAIGSLVSLLAAAKGIPSGYNLDLQEANLHILRPVREAAESVRVLAHLFSGLRFRDAVEIETLSQDVAEELARERGITYREAHSLLASRLREEGWDLARACGELGVRLPEVDEVLARRGVGGPNPGLLSREIESRRRLLRRDSEELAEYEREKLRAEESLLKSGAEG